MVLTFSLEDLLLAPNVQIRPPTEQLQVLIRAARLVQMVLTFFLEDLLLAPNVQIRPPTEQLQVLTRAVQNVQIRQPTKLLQVLIRDVQNVEMVRTFLLEDLLLAGNVQMLSLRNSVPLWVIIRVARDVNMVPHISRFPIINGLMLLAHCLHVLVLVRRSVQ